MSEKEQAQPKPDQPAQPEQPDFPALSMPFRLEMPSFFPSVYAQHMVVQATSDAVLLTFYEVVPPVFTQAPTDETVEKLRKAGIPAYCVARITVPYSSFLDFAEAVAKTAAQLSQVPDLIERARKGFKE
jgi:hypothetical protein